MGIKLCGNNLFINEWLYTLKILFKPSLYFNALQMISKVLIHRCGEQSYVH